MDPRDEKSRFTIGIDSRSVTPQSNVSLGEEEEVTINETLPVNSNGNGITRLVLYETIPVANDSLSPASCQFNSNLSNSCLTLASRNNSGDCLLPFIPKSIHPASGRFAAHSTIRSSLREESYLENSYQNGGPEGSYAHDSFKSPYDSSDETRADSLFSTSLQVCVAFTLAGFGNLGAGLILDMVQHWSVFKVISELFILVPSLLGLKGNLEMTMAARLSTQANLGNMRDFKSTLRMAKGNMALIQCQATVVAFLASLFAISTNAVTKGSFNMNNNLILISSSLLTANVACFLLGACMVAVIVLSHRVEIDPDNVATPLAASIGDVTTLALLASFAQLIQNHNPPGTFPIVSVVIIVILIAALPVWLYIAYKNEYTANVVTTGWIPIIIAMLISSTSGFILNYATSRFDRLAMFQPVINGVGGNLVAVQASRLSTFLHRQCKLGHLPIGYGFIISPCKAFIGSDVNIRTARVLLFMSVPAHFLYVMVFRLIKGMDGFEVTGVFLITYFVFAVLQVILLLYFAHNLVILLWRNATDPDSFSIPVLTSLGDFLGMAFLFIVFILLSLAGDVNALPKII